MSETYSITVDTENQLINVSGDLTFATVNNALIDSEHLFSNMTDLDIDLTEVSRSDSAGLALLVHWLREAKKSNKKIMLKNIPKQMLSIADASSLDELLPVQ